MDAGMLAAAKKALQGMMGDQDGGGEGGDIDLGSLMGGMGGGGDKSRVPDATEKWKHSDALPDGTPLQGTDPSKQHEDEELQRRRGY